ncbi:MAG: hypothetical protein GY860_19825 [Desulfobacteraceae bacterium]|nr:hypothetical protein [Desulfobacteraceae bacterium]
MNPFYLILKNQEGSAIVIALLALAVLSIMGVTSINTTRIELKIVRNEQIYQSHFYQAEAAVMEAAQRLACESNIAEIRPDSTTKAWLVKADIDLENLDTFIANDSTALLSDEASFSVNAQGVVSGASLDMTTGTNMYGFSIYGYSAGNNSSVFIGIGYKKRY